MTVYGYSRVSTDEQTASGLGLAAQVAAIDAEAARRGWTVEHLADTGVSGTVDPAARPVLGPVLDAIGPGDLLVAAKLDRLGRSTLDVLGLADRADREGWSLVVLDLGLDTTTPVGRFTLTALAAVAQLERDLIAQRTRDALAAKRAAGVRLGRPVAVPAEVAERIAADRAAGHTLQRIADALTAEDVPTAQGGARWYPSTVRSVLRSLELDAEAAAARAAA
jgi:DNA invertase Pin-like site-specific DNA recombinase